MADISEVSFFTGFLNSRNQRITNFQEFNRLENNGVEPRFIIPAIFYTILMVIGTFGNLCIIFAVKQKK